MLVRNDNLLELMNDLPREQAEILIPGCETWTITTGTDGSGWMTVWPEREIGAVSWGYGTFWGHWYEEQRLIVLDDEVKAGYQLVVDEAGRLWASATLGEIFRLLQERYVETDAIELLRQHVARQEELLVDIFSMELPIFNGRQLTAAFLEDLEEAPPQVSCH